MENYDVGKVMRMKREALGYTRKEVCELCNGMSEKTLARLEKGMERVRQESIQELLHLYHQRSHAIYPVLDLEDPTIGRSYNEIFGLIFQENYREAKRKLENFERYVNKKSQESIKYIEVLKRELLYFMGEKELRGEETIQFFEKLIEGMMPENADLEKWPLNWQELNAYVAFFNVLAMEKQYETIIPIARKLLVNIEQRYQNEQMFADFHGCITRRLIRCLFEQGQCDEIVELAEKSLKICGNIGDISITYRIQGELLNYFSENDFFNKDELKEQCFESARKMYYLSKVCQDKGRMRYFREYLEELKRGEH